MLLPGEIAREEINDMLEDAAKELRSEGMLALATAVDYAREERTGASPPPSSQRLIALNEDQLSLAGIEV